MLLWKKLWDLLNFESCLQLPWQRQTRWFYSPLQPAGRTPALGEEPWISQHFSCVLFWVWLVEHPDGIRTNYRNQTLALDKLGAKDPHFSMIAQRKDFANYSSVHRDQNSHACYHLMSFHSLRNANNLDYIGEEGIESNA